MKEGIHPESYPAVFVDITCGARFVTRSTSRSEKTEVIDGVEHFVHNVSVSSESHPFYTGKATFVDTAGRIDKFSKRYGSSPAAAGGKRVKRKLSTADA